MISIKKLNGGSKSEKRGANMKSNMKIFTVKI